jgi:signal transduction histidine kinase
MTTLASGLHQVPFLQPLTDEQIAMVVARGTRLTVPAGGVLFRKGDIGHCMYVILAGKVQIYLDAGEGQVLVLGVLGPGDFFGEMALIDGGPRSAGALTVSPCELFVLERAAFLDLLSVSPELLSRLFANLTERLRATDERYLQEEIAKQTVRADMERAQHRSLAQMVAGVAHEVNTPLGIINTAASIIKRELTSDTLTALTSDRKVKMLIEGILETTDLMQKNITRAHSLIQSFKNLSVSQIVDTKDSLKLVEVVNEILALFSIQAKKSKLELEFTHTLTEDQTWVGYRGHLARILLNLLTNIERYAYPAGTGGKVEVRLSSAPPRYILVVRDHGAGISPENLARIFEPFFTTARTQGGTGLGLAMVYNLVTAALHGTVNAESTLNQGTTITITFPQVVPD